jgi:hypothetical protein
MPVFRTLLALLLCASLAWADAELRTLDGKSIKGTLVRIDDTEIIMQGEGGQVKTPLAQVLAIDLRPLVRTPPEWPHTLVKLVDDSQLRCRQVTFKGNQAEMTLQSGQTARVPLAAVSWMLKGAEDQPIRAKWDSLLTEKVKRDQIVILKAGELNPLPGTFGDVDKEGKTIQFRRETGEVVSISLDKLHGMIFYRTEAPAQPPVCMVLDTQGNTLAAAKIAVAGGTYSVTTPAGAQLSLAENVLARLDYNRGKLTFLSDLEPAKVVERSGAGLIVRYRKDANLDGEPISLPNSLQPAKGLSMHAYTELEYDLDGKYKDFKAVLGVDTRTGAESQAVVTIECDGTKKFSETVSAKENKQLSINVRDVRRLRIIVSSQNFLDLHDHATLAEARVSQ